LSTITGRERSSLFLGLGLTCAQDQKRRALHGQWEEEEITVVVWAAAIRIVGSATYQTGATTAKFNHLVIAGCEFSGDYLFCCLSRRRVLMVQ